LRLDLAVEGTDRALLAETTADLLGRPHQLLGGGTANG